jgi:hypothetical protein
LGTKGLTLMTDNEKHFPVRELVRYPLLLPQGAA